MSEQCSSGRLIEYIERFLLAAAVQVFGLVYVGHSNAQDLGCAPASTSELKSRLTRPNTYVLLDVIYPDGERREVVLYSFMLPSVLQYVGATKGSPQKQPFALLSETDVTELLSKPIRFNRTLGPLTLDLAPDEQCPLGGVVETPITEVVWGRNSGLDEIVEKFFEPQLTQDGRLVGFALQRALLPKLTCADIAALLKCNVSLHRSASWSTIILHKRGAEPTVAPTGCSG